MPLTVLSVAYPLAPVTRGTAGGAEQVLSLIDEALVAAGHRSIVVASADSDVRGELVATPVVRGPFDEATVAAAYARCAEAVARAAHGADVVHFHGLDFPPAPRPRMATLHLPPSWYRRIDDALHVVCVSDSERRDAARCDEVIPNGISLDDFLPDADRGDYALILTRICREKNTAHAIDAAKRAGVPLVIAGEVFPYPDHCRYFDEEVRPRLGGGVEYVGPVAMPRKRELLARARCVLLPSTVAETSSLVAMEALACGTPVIAYRSGALPEIVGDGGVIVDTMNEMAEAIGRIDAIDRARCRRIAEERFDARVMTARYIGRYGEIAR